MKLDELTPAMLKKAGAQNVICFSYGQADHWEARTSHRVAETLGFAWKFVPFTRRKWRAMNLAWTFGRAASRRPRHLLMNSSMWLSCGT